MCCYKRLCVAIRHPQAHRAQGRWLCYANELHNVAVLYILPGNNFGNKCLNRSKSANARLYGRVNACLVCACSVYAVVGYDARAPQYCRTISKETFIYVRSGGLRDGLVVEVDDLVD
jgi:hypothetical protein